jgi:hypothetical protein
MVAEATSQTQATGFALPAGIYRRQAWLPAGLRGVASILQVIASRTKPVDSRRARLTAWYEQFVQRSQPFIDWQPLTTAELKAEDTHSSFGSIQSQERIWPRESPMISKDLPPVTRQVSGAQDQASATHPHQFAAEQPRPQEPFLLPRVVSGPIHTAVKSIPPSERNAGDPSGAHERPIEGPVQPLAPPAREQTAENPAQSARSPEETRLPAKDRRPARKDGTLVSPLPTPLQRNEEQSLVRPALRLAILGPINRAAGTVQRKESSPLSSGTSGFSSGATKNFAGPQYSLGETQPVLQPRLVSSVSSLPRQEVRGGFPVSAYAEVPRDADTSFEDLVEGSVRDITAVRNDGASESRSLASSRHAEISGPPALPPVTVPGVQIRLLRSDEPPRATQPSGSKVAEGSPSILQLPKAQPPAPAPPPPLDINAVADKVYQALRRRHQFERERRGLY